VRRVVFVTQRVDPDDPALGATVPMLRALAERVDEVAVLALSAVEGVLPENCRVGTFGGRSRLERLARYEAALLGELRRRPERLVAHMAPIYAVLAAPPARARGVRTLLWFNHWKASRTLRLAERLVDRVVSVDRLSFPLPSAKLVPIGHGIDLAQFRCRPLAEQPALRTLALGRTSPAKGLETLVRAVAQVEGASLTIRGPSLTDEESRHRAELERLAQGLPVEIGGPVPRGRIPELFASHDLFLNNMRPGAADKVVYEAAASCLPVLASNPSFAELVEPFPRDDPDELARRLRAFAALSAEERARLGHELRERVAERHSVESWADGILAA
jgi:glycosyltransferase involved in cell wall biosynthesis